MNQDQSDILKSFEETQKLFDDNAAKITGISALTAGKSALDSFITNLKMWRAIQDVDQTGLAEGKQALRVTTTNNLLDVASALTALGTISNDPQMVNQFNYSKSELERKRIDDFLNAANTTVIAANNNMASLTSFTGLTAGQVTTLTTNSAALSLANTTPDQAINAKKVATANIKETFPVVRKHLDNLITPLMRTNFFVADHDFYLLYIESLQIVNTGHHFLDVFGVIFNPTTNSNLADVTIKVLDRNNNNAQVMKLKSGDKGHYQIKQLPEGSYTFQLSLPDYAVKEEIVNKGEGINIKKNFAMDPL